MVVVLSCLERCSETAHTSIAETADAIRGEWTTSYRPASQRSNGIQTRYRVTVTKSQIKAIALVPDEFHKEWNYKLEPQRN